MSFVDKDARKIKVLQGIKKFIPCLLIHFVYAQAVTGYVIL